MKKPRLSAEAKKASAELEAAARALHKASNPPRLTELKINPLTGNTELYLLGTPRVRFLPSKQIEILDRAFMSIALGSQPFLSEVRSEVSKYLSDLLKKAEDQLTREHGETLQFDAVRGATYGKLRNTLWSVPADHNLYKLILSYLWQCIDREIASLTFQIESPAGSTLKVYRWAFLNRKVLLEAKEKTPNLLPLTFRYGRLFQPEGDLWENEIDFLLPDDWLQHVKNHLKGLGMTEAGWRVLTCCGTGAIQAWRSVRRGEIDLVNYAGVAGMRGIPASFFKSFNRSRLPELVQSTSRENSSYYAHISLSSTDAATFVRLAVAEAERARKKKRLKMFLNGELLLVADALYAQSATYRGQRGHVDFWGTDPAERAELPRFKLPRQVSWKWLLRFQERWHEEQAALSSSDTDGRCWTSLVEAFEHNGYQVDPLVDAHALYLEGKRMHHCVNSPHYADACTKNQSRIFSIRKAGTDNGLATVELRRSSYEGTGPWMLSQCFGICNTTAPKAVSEVSKEVLKRYAKAQRKADRDAQTMHVMPEKESMIDLHAFVEQMDEFRQAA